MGFGVGLDGGGVFGEGEADGLAPAPAFAFHGVAGGGIGHGEEPPAFLGREAFPLGDGGGDKLGAASSMTQARRRSSLPRRRETRVWDLSQRPDFWLSDMRRSLNSAWVTLAMACHWVWERMERNRQDRHLGEVVRQLEEQREWLLRPGFAWKAGPDRMKRYQRYFYGMEERINRLETQPLIRDEEKQDQFLPLWDEWLILWSERPEAVRLWEIGWMLEEWRLQLFAPGVPRVGKVSAKRIEKALEI